MKLKHEKVAMETTQKQEEVSRLETRYVVVFLSIRSIPLIYIIILCEIFPFSQRLSDCSIS